VIEFRTRKRILFYFFFTLYLTSLLSLASLSLFPFFLCLIFFQTFMNQKITILPLGAGQDVGRSCILVTMGGKTIMLDCGMHMGYQDSRRFLTLAKKQGSLTLAFCQRLETIPELLML
jgi:hypothetical protein